MTQFSYVERFFSTAAPRGGMYAPMTIGAPANLYRTDRSVFSHSKAEKQVKKQVKKDWKDTMIRVYGENWRKFDNPPEQLMSI